MRCAIAILTTLLIAPCLALVATAFADRHGESQNRGGGASTVAALLPDVSAPAAQPGPGAVQVAPECATCTACHGTDHEAIVAADGGVLDGVCGGCHPAQYGD